MTTIKRIMLIIACYKDCISIVLKNTKKEAIKQLEHDVKYLINELENEIKKQS